MLMRPSQLAVTSSAAVLQGLFPVALGASLCVGGPNALAVAALLTPLLGVVVLIVAVLGIVATQRGAAVTELLPRSVSN